MNHHPCVDVIVPVFNSRNTIKAALQSVIAQHGCLVRKIIVVDDGSIDGTANVIQDLNNPLVQLISTPNRGVARARNLAISQANAEWIAFLDADDVWTPNKLQVQLAAARTHGAGFVCASVSARSAIPAGRISPSMLTRGNFIATSSVLVKRNILCMNCPVFLPGMTFSEDYLAWLKCLTLTPGYYLSNNLVNYSLSRYPRYRWTQILLCMVTLNLHYFMFLQSSGINWPQRFKLIVAVLLGSSRSLLSVVKRFISSYTLHQASQ